MDKFKIVVDSNVLISAAMAMFSNKLRSPSVALLSGIIEKEVVAVASPQMLYELADTLSRPRFQLSGRFVIDYIDLVASSVEMVSIRGLDMGCRDDDDDMFIETAVNGRVDMLVTRDDDLHDARIRYDLAKRRCQVLSVSEFLTILRGATRI